MAKYIFGIDLGTTYSCIAYVDEHARTVVADNYEGENTTPSVVFFESPTNVIVGQVAKESAVLNPQNTVSLVKSKMGKTDFAIRYNGEDKTPEEVSAYILRKLAKDAGESLGTEVKDVVITCPAYFGDAERKATRSAGEIAGLNVLEIISEPTAAALHYGCEKEQEEKTVLVYDLGGGTFDVTVMRIYADGRIEEICHDGWHELGGKNWDDEIMKYLAAQFREITGFKGNFNEADEMALRLQAEKIKKSLSKRSEYPATVQVGELMGRINISRETFDNLTRHLLNQSLEKTDAAIAVAEKRGYRVDEILLVGGSTRMPQVSRALAEKYGIEPKPAVNPDEAVARGAAIYALGVYEIKADEVRKKLNSGEIDLDKEADREEIEKYKEDAVVDTIMLPGLHGHKMSEVVTVTTTKSYALEVIMSNEDVKCRNMIFKNVRMEDGSVSVTKQYGTHVDNQQTAELIVYESDFDTEYYEIDEDFKLGTASLELPGNLPAHSPLEVTFTLNREGILEVTGRDMTSNREIHVTMQTSSGSTMSEEEIKTVMEKSRRITVE